MTTTKLLFSALASLVLAVPAFAAAPASAPAADMPTKAAAVGDPTLLIACQIAAYPGGVACASPVSLGQVYNLDSTTAAMTNVLGCSTLGSGVFNCPSGAPLPGVFITYIYSGTTDVSRIIYIAR